MSSDAFTVTILSLKNRNVVLRIRAGFAGGRNDYACTRSFALSVLADARRRFNENTGRFKGRKATATTALEKEARAWPGSWQVSEEFFAKNVGKYVVKTTVSARKNEARSNDFSSEDREALEALENEGLTPAKLEDALCERFHFIELDVQMTDSKWLRGLEEGWVFGTTAYDVWWKDPLRPKVPKSTKVAKKPGTASAPKKPKPGVLEPGARVDTSLFPAGARAVLLERRKAKLSGTLARIFESHEFALLKSDDGHEFWVNVPNVKVVRTVDVYEEGRSDPDAFWARVMKLSISKRAQEVARAIGGGGVGTPDPNAPRYPVGSRRVVGFLAPMSLEQAARAIGEAFPQSGRPKTFTEHQKFEPSPRDFSKSDFKPFQGEKVPKFKPDCVVMGLVGALAWRIAEESAASKKPAAAIVPPQVLDALKNVPEAQTWMPFFRSASVLPAKPRPGQPGKYGLPGFVIDGGTAD